MKFLIPSLSLLFSAQIYANTLTYHCALIGGVGNDETLVIDGDKITLEGDGFSDQFYFTASIDKTQSNKGQVRFNGEEDGENRIVDVQEKLLSGASKGKISISDYDNGLWSADFTCKLAE